MSAASKPSGSPFVVGRPLRPSEPIFGRDEAFRHVHEALQSSSSVNLIGERRMGKTSLLNHLVAHADRHLDHADPPLKLARIDLQGGVSSAGRFYAAALRQLAPDHPLGAASEVDFAAFENALRQMRGVVRPVIIIDEFERLLEEDARAGFPYPLFYNNLRSLIGDQDALLTMIVASRRPLIEYFTDPKLPGSLTSTFPSYFQPFTLRELERGAADALILQPGGHTLQTADAHTAWRWAHGHPCRQQIAGQALYSAWTTQRSLDWAQGRYRELLAANCAVPNAPAAKLARGLFRRALWDGPMGIGRVVQGMGRKVDDMAAWVIGLVIIVLVVLLIFGVISASEIGGYIRNAIIP